MISPFPHFPMMPGGNIFELGLQFAYCRYDVMGFTLLQPGRLVDQLRTAAHYGI